jgi:hypothetical protein
MSLTLIDQHKWVFSINNNSKISFLNPLKSILQNFHVGIVKRDFSSTIYNILHQELIRVKAIPVDSKLSSISYLISSYGNGYCLLRKLKSIKNNNLTLKVIDLKFQHCPLVKKIHPKNFPSLHFSNKETTNSPINQDFSLERDPPP